MTKAKTKAKAKAKTTAAPSARDRRNAQDILNALAGQHPEAHCELDFDNALELLIATILAAQCTDKRVNMVTKTLFQKYRTAGDYLKAKDSTLEDEIRTTGFFRNKTKAIKKACQSIAEQYDNKVPATMEELLTLQGVGRKTANCILGNVFGVPGIVVDTHMLRLSRRMGFTENTDATKVEHDLMQLFPEDDWIRLSHLIPWHGRRVCGARKPQCDTCEAAHACPKLI